MKMHTKQMLNDPDRGKPKYWEENLSHCHFVRPKTHMDWPWIEIWPPRWGGGDGANPGKLTKTMLFQKSRRVG